MDNVQDKFNDKENVDDSMDISGEEPTDNMVDSSDTDSKNSDGSKDDLPKGVRERLGRQEKKHQREMRQNQQIMREMKDQLDSLHVKYGISNDQNNNPYDGGMGDSPTGIDEHIHKAVSYALRHKELEERKAQDLENRQRMADKYENFSDHLDGMNDRYSDFEDVVRAPKVRFTETMRDVAALLLPTEGPGSAGEVLYKLGKDKDLLDRISRKSPDDQGRELVKLSIALSSSGESKNNSSRPLGNIKSNPVTNSAGITEKTSVSELRKRMKTDWGKRRQE